MSDIELNPCPFCGDTNSGFDDAGSGHSVVFCVRCGISGPDGADDEKAARLWNARADEALITTLRNEVERLRGPKCPDCEGEGWTVGVDYDTRCCGRSDWECGGRGCTGPIQEQVQVQEQCERCGATGEVDEKIEALHAAEEALGLLFHDYEPGTLSLQRSAWLQVRAALGIKDVDLGDGRIGPAPTDT